MTWNEYQRRVNEYNQREWRAWDRTRRIACEVYNNMNEKRLDYEQYISLPTDYEAQQQRAKAKLAADLAFLEMMKRSGRI